MGHRLLAVLIATVLVGAGFSAPADPQSRYYLALGDSLAYGYQPVQPLDRTQGYAYRVHAAHPQLMLENLSCSGETTTTLLRGGICQYPEAASQLAAAERFLGVHRGRVALVTLDVGANDITPCARGGVIDQACVDRAYRTVAGNLVQIVLRLRLVAPQVRIVAMTYYNPNLAAYLQGAAGQQLAGQALTVGNRFNAILTAIYRLAGIQVADVAGAFATNDSTPVTVAGLGQVPLNVARICQWTWMCAPRPLGPDIHANAAGYAVMAGAFLAEIPTSLERVPGPR